MLAKAGLVQEGCRREYVEARAREETIETHGVLRWEWEAQRRLLGNAPPVLHADSPAGRTAALG